MLEYHGPHAEKPPARSWREFKKDAVDAALSLIVGDTGDPIIEFCQLFAFAGVIVFFLERWV